MASLYCSRKPTSVIASENGRPLRFSANHCGRGSEPVMVVSSGRSFETVSTSHSVESCGYCKVLAVGERGRQGPAVLLGIKNASSLRTMVATVAAARVHLRRSRRGSGHRVG